MNLADLKKVKRTLTQSRKTEVIEELAFKDANTCHENFEKTGSLPHLRVACQAWRLTLKAIRDQSRYGVATDEG